jgi:hypothetical protein
MIRFVDLESGNIFNASKPYVFWFEGEQSTNLIYTKPICFISNKRRSVVSIPKSGIFSILDTSKLDTELDNIYGFEYQDINSLKTNTITIPGYRYDDYYVYIVYIGAQSELGGEFVDTLTIDGEEFSVGADFYEENESLYVNLSNNGIEIPNSIQKAIYEVNPHEDKRDNITLNRKWKELLANLWDTVSNKGSYKSLHNTLNWFEWGDMLKLCEVWKRTDEKDIYSIRDIKAILGDKYFETLSGFSKTTYIAIYCALQKMKLGENQEVIYDSEKNPVLQNIVSRWSTRDLSLKLCMLGNFYKTYFMPIHLDLIHCTIEDVVFTNTFKMNVASGQERNDFVYLTHDFDCSVKDGDIFKLSPVKAFVGEDTLFGDLSDNQRFNDIGCIVDFTLDFPLLEEEKIKREYITYVGGGEAKSKVDYRVLGSKIEFSLLLLKEGEYDIRMQFDTTAGRTFTKRVILNVIDTTHTTLKVYRVQNIRSPKEEAFFNINNYIFGRQIGKTDTNPTKQYLSTKLVDPNTYKNWGYTGVCLNHLLILEGPTNHYVDVNYFTFELTRGGVRYTICISKRFAFKPQDIFLEGLSIYRNDYIFVPEYHKLVELGSERGDRKEDIKYYTITDDDTLCVVPELAFGKCIEDIEWEFVNVSSLERISIPGSIKEPFIANTSKTHLTPGYYDIVFRYRLSGEDQINTVVINSAFRKI